MPMIIGVNSWATIAEADLYLTTKLGTQSWFNLNDSPANPGEESKETFLIMAFNTLYDKPGYDLQPLNTDEDLKKAQAELAFYFVSNYATFIQESDNLGKGISSFSLSKWSESYFSSWIGDFPLPVMTTKFISNYRMDNATVQLVVD